MTKNIFLLCLLFLTKSFFGQSEIVWAKSFLGNLGSECPAIYADASGNVYTTGQFEGTVDFDPGPATFTLTSFGNWDAYLVKTDALGNFLWAKQIGGTKEDIALNMTFDATGNIYITGYFAGTSDFDPGPSTFTLTGPTSMYSTFIVKLDSNGNFIWASHFTGSGNCEALSIAVDLTNNSYVTGSFDGTIDFDPGPSTYSYTYDGNANIFIAKLDNSGDFVWAKKIDGFNGARALSLCYDGANSIYTTGWFSGTPDFDPGVGTFTLTSNGFRDIFISRLDLSGNFIWTKQVGSPGGDDFGKAIITDAASAIYLTGGYSSTIDLDPGPGSATFTTIGGDMFLLKLDPSGNFIFAKSFSSNSYSFGNSIALDVNNNIYTTGYFSGTTDFDPSLNSFTHTSAGSFDVFISKLDPSGAFLFAKRIGGTGNDDGQDIYVDGVGNVYTSGFFNSTVDFDPGPPSYTMTAGPFATAFLIKQDASVGLNEFNKNFSVSFFPNPTNENLYIKFQNYDLTNITIANSVGQIVFKSEMNSPTNNLTIDTGELPSGIYFLQLKTNIGLTTKKFIKTD